MAGLELGGTNRPLTPAEESFVADVVGDQPPLLDVWLHVDADGSPWLLISCDFVVDGVVRDTLRLDFDGRTAKGGWSPFLLNGDDGVRADAAGVDCGEPDGLSLDVESVRDAADHARRWFERHYEAWPESSRRKRFA